MPSVYLEGQRRTLQATQLLGQGGEAEVYDLGDGRALKLYKPPKHADFQNDPAQQEGARQRIAEIQQKLRNFPSTLPDTVVTPQVLAYDASGQSVLGYAMQKVAPSEVLLRYSEKTFREGGVPPQVVIEIFRSLHQTLELSHKSGLIFGDLNDLNVLVQGTTAYLIDTDSAQFGLYRCRVFTERFLDPLLADPKGDRLCPIHPFSEHSDWYAYAVMLMRCLLFVDPYGGIYRPKNPQERMPHGQRPLQRVTVFHPEVQYPRPALRYDVLPDDLLQCLYRIFVKDERGVFPATLLEDFRWTRCSACGREHARSQCPECQQAHPARVRETVRIRGRVVSTRVFQTQGRILSATFQDGRLHYVYAESGGLYREGGQLLFQGEPTPTMRWGIAGAQTWVAQNRTLLGFTPQGTRRIQVDVRGGQEPIFTTTSTGVLWCQQGQLMREAPLGPERIGDVLEGQTLLWAQGPMGVGLYRANEYTTAFVFSPRTRGINDTVRIPPIRGQLTGAVAHISDSTAWIILRTQRQGRDEYTCTVLSQDGKVLATHQEVGDQHWMAHARGACALGRGLYVPTDAGILALDTENGRVIQAAEFPDTQHFVHSGHLLLAGTDGLYAVSANEIQHLKITPG